MKLKPKLKTPEGAAVGRASAGVEALAAFRWLLEAGCPVDWDAAEAAVGRSRFQAHNDRSQTLQWLGNARREREGMAAVAQ